MDNDRNHCEGVVTVADRAVMQIAVYAARRCRGVAAMSERSRTNETFKNVTGRGDSAGVYVKNTKSGVILDVYIACGHGANVTELKSDVAYAVGRAFAPTGVRIRAVNVHVNSVI